MTTLMDKDEGRPVAARTFERWSDELYRNLVERVPAVVYIDSDDQLPDSIYISPQVEDLLGHPPSAYLADPDLWRSQAHPDDVPVIAEAWRRSRESGRPFELEYRMIHRDGREIWVHDSSVSIRADDGTTTFWQGVLYDVTSAKRAERELREAEEKYRALVENLPAVVYLVAPDDDRRTLYVSHEVERSLGYAREEWLEQPDIWMELLHPDDREPTLGAYDHHNETGQPWSREYRLIASDGRAVWFRDVATLVRDGAGSPLHWQGLQLDITELKRVEDELRRARDDLEMRVAARTAALEEANALLQLEVEERRRAEAEAHEAEHRYRTLAEQIPAVTYTWATTDPSLGYTSPRIEQLLGYTPEDWNDPDLWISRLHPDDRTRVLAEAIRSETTGEPFSLEYRYLHRDGHIVWVLDQGVLLSRDPEGKPRTFQGVMLDITARKEAEAKARESETRYQALTEDLPGVTYVFERDPETGASSVVYVSPQVTPMLGFTPKEWASDPAVWASRIHTEDAERVLGILDDVEGTGEPWSVEYRLHARDGSVVWVQDQGRLLARDGLGRPTRFQGLMVDITDRRRQERSQREIEVRYRTLVEQLPAITYIEVAGLDPRESGLAYLSPQTESILGYTAEELIADRSHLERSVHPLDQERVFEANRRSDETGEPFDETYRFIARDGRLGWLHSRAVLVRDEDGVPRYWHGVALDVTSQMEAQKSLRELEERYRDLAGRGSQTADAEPTGS